MDRRIIIILLAMVIGIFGTLAVYYGFYIIEIEDIPMDVSVGTKIGINSDKDALHFGTVLLGGTSQRKLFVANKNKFPVLFVIQVKGEFSDWITIKQNNFELAPYANTSVRFLAKAPEDVDFGTYNGTATIRAKRILW